MKNLLKKVFFLEEENLKFIVVGYNGLEGFSLQQLYSTEVFPFRKYFPEGIKDADGFILTSQLTSKEYDVSVTVWRRQ